MLTAIKFILGIVVALVVLSIALHLVVGIFYTLLHLLFPVLVLVGAGFLIYTVTNRKALSGGNSRYLP